MTRTAVLGLASLLVFSAVPPIHAQVAGSTKVAAAIVETRELATGWSVKKQILGKTVYNEENQKVGKIDDIIIAPDKTVSYAIVGAGGFVGVGKHDVAISIDHFSEQNGRLILAGATKDMIKAMPKFEYAKKQ
jgi:sporulation protein YlmC with PRC-barrel domain